MIPKTLHYCWFGNKRKPKLVKDCITSWKTILADYELIEWNESNSDLSHPFVREAYVKKKWAFVADFVRLDIIYKFGGIYLDTDMLVIKNLSELLKADCFFGAEDSEFISCGIIGAKKNFQFIKDCKSRYDSISFDSNFGKITIPRLITAKFKSLYSSNFIFDKIIFIYNITIYPPEYFYPISFLNKNDISNFKDFLFPESYAVHLWSSSWIEYSEFYYLENRNYIKGFLIIIKCIIKKKRIEFNYLKKIASSLYKSI